MDSDPPGSLDLGHGTVDLRARRFHPAGGGAEVPLTQREVDLLAYLAHHPGRMIGRDELAREVWSGEPDISVRTVDTAIRRLRTKLEPGEDEPRVLLGGEGEGLRLVLPAAPRTSPLTLLPRPEGAFVGRVGELAQLATTLSAQGLVVLVGEEGVGKTRLAIELAVRASRPARFVRLDGVVGAEELRCAVAAGLGIELPPGEEPDDRIRAAMVGSLAVLDGLDGCADAAAELLPRWVSVPNAVILGTSTAPLFVPGERVVSVGPLDPEASIALFHARAEAAGRAVDAGEREAVEALVARVGGNPFALELAATWSAVLDPRSVLGRIETPPDRLGVAVGRTTLLDAVVRSAWVLLTAEEQDVLAACARFPSVFDAHAVAALSDAPARTPAALLALRRKGLVRAGSGKWLELAGGVRAFARDARPIEREVSDERFGKMCFEQAEKLAEALDDPAEARNHDAELGVAVGRLRALTPTWEAPVVAALGPALDAAGWFEVHGACVDRALAHGAEPHWRAQLLERRASALLALGNDVDASVSLTAAAEALDAQEVDDPVIRAEIELDWATIAGAAGRGDEVVDRTRRAAELVRRARDPRAGSVWMVIGANLLAAGDRGGAVDAYLEAVHRARVAGSHRRAAHAFIRLANVAIDAGSVPEASGRVGDAESELRVLGVRAPPALLRVRGALAELRGDVRLAESEWREAANLASTAEGPWSQHECRLALARCALRRGDLEEAWGLCAAAAAAARGKWTAGWVEASVLLAIVYARQGARVEAERIRTELHGPAEEASAFIGDVLDARPVGAAPEGAYLMKRLRYALGAALGPSMAPS